MIQKSSFSIKSFLHKLSEFTDQNNFEKNLNPTKRRDIREVVSLINKLLHHLENYDDNNLNPLFIDDKILLKIDQQLQDFYETSDLQSNSRFLYKLLNAVADIYTLLDDIPQAIENFNNAITLSQKSDNQDLEAFSKYKLGKIHIKVHQWDLATTLLSEAEQYYQNINDFRKAMKCKYNLGRVYYKIGKYVSAYRAYKNTFELAEKINDEWIAANIKNYLGTIARIFGNKKESEKLLKSACKSFKEKLDNVGYIECLNNLSMTYLQNSNYQKALSGFNECITMCEQLQNSCLMAYINLNKAIFYLEVGDPRNAAKFCTQALELLAQNNNTIGLPKVSRIYGNIFKIYQQYKIADKFFIESIHLYEKLEIPLGLANCCSDYAEMLVDQNHVDESIAYYKMALKIYGDLELNNYVEKLEKTINSPRFAIQTEMIPKKIFSLKQN